jgi:hypothetical protein
MSLDFWTLHHGWCKLIVYWVTKIHVLHNSGRWHVADIYTNSWLYESFSFIFRSLVIWELVPSCKGTCSCTLQARERRKKCHSNLCTEYWRTVYKSNIEKLSQKEAKLRRKDHMGQRMMAIPAPHPRTGHARHHDTTAHRSISRKKT